MAKFKRFICFALAAVLLAGLLTACGSSGNNSRAPSADGIIAGLNAARQQEGTPALTKESDAMERAQKYAVVMANAENGMYASDEEEWAAWRAVSTGRAYVGYNYFLDEIPDKATFLRWYNNGVVPSFYHQLVSDTTTTDVGVGIVPCKSTKSGYVIIVVTYTPQN